MKPEGKALKEQYQWEAKAQWKGKPLKGNVAIFNKDVLRYEAAR